MKLSLHAKKRLKERFKFTDSDIVLISALFNQKYKVVKSSDNRKIREIDFYNKIIHGVIANNKIVTCFSGIEASSKEFNELLNALDTIEELKQDNILLEHEVNVANKKLRRHDKLMLKIRTADISVVNELITNIRNN